MQKELEKYNSAKVDELEISEGFKARPEALNTVNLLKIASSCLGMGPQQAMHVAERLYLSGMITYPRTESTSYPNNFEFKSVISALTDYDGTRNYANKLLKV